MKIKFLLIILNCMIFFGCKTNQKINKIREGFWVESYKLGNDEYKSSGFYKKGNPVQKWKYLKNDTIYQKEKYRKNICKTIYYHKNGKIMQRGQSKIEIKEGQTHWFYFGDWFYFNENQKLTKIKHYENGLVVSETNF